MKKTILITGSTDGIGKLAAIKLAKEGHEIYLHGRSLEKLNSAISEVKAHSGNEHIKGFIADFSELENVKKMAQQIVGEISKIDILINNAGVFNSPKSENSDGIDIRLVVNYLAPFLLTNELLPLLNKGADARIINVSSAAQAPVSNEALSGNARLSVQQAYAQSKLALTMWSFYLAEVLSGITVIAVNPGSLLNTKMANEAYGQYWAPAEKGSNILYDLAVSEEYKGVTKKYFDNDKGEQKGIFGPAHADAYNQTAINQLLEATKKVVLV